ncbi:MAG: class I SAM-dependent methyltransferase [Pyrinomonadaceae bacterium]
MPPTFERFAKYYDRALAPLERFYFKRLRSEALSLVPAGGRILEIGAGTGANFEFYPKTACAIASEISIKMIEIANGKTATIPLVQADAQSLPFPANNFDAAFATLVFCSIPRPKLAFAELIRTLRPGGRLILLEHVRPDGLLGYVFDFLNLFSRALIDDHFNRQTAWIAADAGLELVEVRKMAFGIINLITCRTKM